MGRWLCSLSLRRVFLIIGVVFFSFFRFSLPLSLCAFSLLSVGSHLRNSSAPTLRSAAFPSLSAFFHGCILPPRPAPPESVVYVYTSLSITFTLSTV